MLSRTTVEEARSLLDYFRTQHGYSNIVIAGTKQYRYLHGRNIISF